MKGIRLFLALLAILTLLSPHPAGAAGGDPAALFDFAALPDASGILITKYKGTEEEVAIPQTIDGLQVTAIDGKAFYGCDFILSLGLPEGLKSIGDYAFWNCKALPEAILPDSLETIGKWAFAGCGSLKTMRIPALVSSIGDAAFAACGSLEAFETDPANAFYASDDGVLVNVAAATLAAYPGARPGRSYTLPAAVETIGERAFADSRLTSVTLPEGLREIAQSAFLACENLEQAQLPDSLKVIGPGAFSGCRSLAEVRIPALVESIGPYAWKMCASLSSFRVDEANAVFASPDGVLFNSRTNTLVCYPPAGAADSYILPETTLAVGNAAFFGCENLVSVRLPEGLAEIGADAFRNCGGMDKIAIPSSVSAIGKNAFAVYDGEIILQVRQGSYGAQYALENGLNTEAIP